jgi:DNA-binding NarL/FixJ family response regulator
LDALSPNLPGGGLIGEIRRRSHSIKVVLIDMEEDRDVFLECTRAGAVGYFLKDASANNVLCGIRSVSNGHAVYPPQMCLPLLLTISRRSPVFPSARAKLELGLTRRQQQLVPLISQGLTNKEIASCLNLSEQTVKNHVHNMLKRVGVENRLELIDATQKFRALQPATFVEMEAHRFSMTVSGRHILEPA